MDPKCPVCKNSSDCDWFISGSVFGIFMSKDFEDSKVINKLIFYIVDSSFTINPTCFLLSFVNGAQIVPCNARLVFTELYAWEKDTMRFEAFGHAYDFDVVTKKPFTRLGGDGWKRFLTRNPISYGDQMIAFQYGGGTPKIHVLYFRGGDVSVFNPDHISKPCKLSEHEHNHFFRILPELNTYVGFPFVSRLKRKNLAKHSMVCSFK